MAISVGPLPVSSSMEDPLSLTKRGETPSLACPGPIQLTPRFTALKESLVLGKESIISSSWHRLIQRLPAEIDVVSSLGPKAIPTIRFQDTANSQQADRFLQNLGQRGVGIIRGVVPRDTALFWNREAEEYLGRSLPLKSPPDCSQSQDVFWSPAQVSARAHPNLLAAQKFVMSVWKSRDENARVTTNFPISYADRMGSMKGGGPEGSHYASVDGGSVERWEPDGYGRAGTYEDIFQGNWEDYNPWESSTRLGVTSDLYRRAGACSIFRMFQGWLALLPVPSGPGSVQVCPLPRHATAYFLLRPFFTPLSSFSSTSPPPPPPTEADDDAAQWAFNYPQNSILHGALPSYAQQITPSLHPHLQLDRSLVPVPDLEPGDYLVWHPDLIHRIIPTQHGANHTAASKATAAAAAAAYIYLPACPLTQTNALYLARQRKAFLHGHPGPDFGWGGHGHGRGESGDQVGSGTGNSSNSSNSGISQQGAQEVGDAGGDDGLRAMGLLPWDEEEADEDKEREVLAMANGILFPDLYDMYE